MNTPRDEKAFDPRNRLAEKKRIDAVCDRFEAAWDEGRQPRIEAYLAEALDVERAELFRELLASELSLRPANDPYATRERYLERFPEFRECVLAAFAKARPMPSPNHPRQPDEGRAQWIESVRERLSLKENRAIAIGREKAASPAPAGPAVEQLWDALVRSASGARSNRHAAIGSADIEKPEDVAGKLLDAFPTFRREILLRLLLGETIEHTAERHHCSERTVVATCRAASELLGRSPTA